LVVVNTSPPMSEATHNVSAAHETPLRGHWLSIVGETDQAGSGSVGSVVTTACPPSSTATQRLVDGQDTAAKPWLSMGTGPLQVGVVAPGSVEITACPLVSTATQSEVDGQEMPVSQSPGAGVESIIHGPPHLPGPVGSVEIIALPSLVTAAQSAVGVHDRPEMDSDASSGAKINTGELQLGVGSVGVVEVTALAVSTPTHNPDAGQEMKPAVRPVPVRVQLGLAAVGSVEISARPSLSVAAHNVVDTQETASRLLAPAMSLGGVQVGGVSPGSVDVVAPPKRSSATHSALDAHDTDARL
jgi:hypothetical protein